MIIEGVPKGMESAPFGETIKIIDEMDHLLCEMNEIMAAIKRILGEENADHAFDSPIEETFCFRPQENVVHSS